MILYMRSSMLGSLDVCEQQFFINYILGYESKTGKKATLGSATHKILEILARINKQFADTKKDKIVYKDSEIKGLKVTVNKDDFLKESTLTPVEVDKINTSRINKDVYRTKAFIEYNHKRYGAELVDYLCEVCSEHYKKHDHNDWQPIDMRHIWNWVNMALDFNNSQFDPRRQNIVEPEKHFDIEITDDWGRYEYFIGDQHLKGNLRLKGTIDLTVKVDDDYYSIIDYKSGRKVDWATGKPKTYVSLQNDPQLLMYYYVGRNLYPDKHIDVNIFFIRDGGPYSFAFDDQKYNEGLDLLKKRFQYIKNLQVPKLLDEKHKHFLCNRICTFYKEKMGNKRMCDFIHQEVKSKGIDYVIEKHTREGFNRSFYQAPGEI